MKALTLYNESMKITEASAFQAAVFNQPLKWYNDKVYRMVAFDTETTGLMFGAPSMLHLGNSDILVHDIKVFGISLAIPYNEKIILVWGRYGTPLFDQCCDFLERPIPKVGHNVRYDYRVCRRNGIEVNGELHCTLTMARIHWNRRKKVALDALVGHVFPEEDGYDSELKAVLRNLRSSYTRQGYPKDYVNYSFIPDEVISRYAMLDVFVTWLLNLQLMPHMKKTFKQVYRRERKVILEIADIEDRGVPFNRRRAKREASDLLEKVPTIKARLFKSAGGEFNPNSYKQLHKILLKKLKVPRKLLMLKGKITTEKVVLEDAVKKLRSKKLRTFAQDLLDLRSINKIVGTYLEPLRQRAEYNVGVIYCNINPADTVTGRMTSTDPNLQNVPRPRSIEQKYNPVRKCFPCRAGFFDLFFDYKQMEMWLTAIITGENTMLTALKGGEDIHAATAIGVLGDAALDDTGNVLPHFRQEYKHVNFAIIYGMGVRGLAKKIRISFMEARDLKNGYMERYSAIDEFILKCAYDLKHQGYVEDLFGRRYNLDPRDAYKAINALVQGSCAQIFKIALLRLGAYTRSLNIMFGVHKPHLLLPLHDEIWTEFPKREINYTSTFIKTVKHHMEKIPQLEAIGIPILPVDVKMSTTNWEDKKPYNKKVLKSILRKAG